MSARDTIKSRSTGVAQALGLPAVILAAWWFATARMDSVYFPTPPDIFRAGAGWLAEDWRRDLMPSLVNLVVGYALAVVVGVVAGYFIGTNVRVYQLLIPLVDFFRSIPKPALIPPMVLILGLGAQSRITIIAIASLWPILLGMVDGVRGMNGRYGDVAAVYRISGWRRSLKVVLPAASPALLAGMSTAVGVAVVMVVFSEMYASASGIGYAILYSQRQFDIATMWAGTVLLGVIGFVASFAFERFRRRVLSWQQH